MARSVDLVAIDAPLGWPAGFVTAVGAHASGSGWPDLGQRQLRFRVTDLHVQPLHGDLANLGVVGPHRDGRLPRRAPPRRAAARPAGPGRFEPRDRGVPRGGTQKVGPDQLITVGPDGVVKPSRGGASGTGSLIKRDGQPWAAGDRAHGGIGCTTGFLVRAKPQYGTWKHYILTAGHCVAHSGGTANNVNWENGAGTVVCGHNQAMDFWDQDGCGFLNTCRSNDLGLVGMGNASPSDWNEYLTGTESHVPITDTTTRGNQLIGQVVFRHGRTSGLDSGDIVDKTNAWSYGCFRVPASCTTPCRWT